MQIELTIGQLAEAIEKFKQLKLQHEQEIKVDDLDIMVPTPTGHQPIRHFIKKEQLQCRTVSLADGRRFTAAEKHIVVDKDGKDQYVNDLQSGTNIKTRNGLMTVVSSYDAGIRDCYDIGIDAPHVYYDAAGILHHNTIISAVLSHKCEPYGRTVIIVPNTDLIRQTEADYKNLGLDVGVFYGGRKEYTKTHTICTWQSLNSLFKKTKAGEAQIPFSDFIDGVVCVMVDECLAAGTKISTPDGLKNIEDMVPGDKVYSLNESTNEFIVDEVVKLHTNLPKSDGTEMFEFELEDGSTIQITGNHKVLTDRGWVEAALLIEGDNIRSYL